MGSSEKFQVVEKRRKVVTYQVTDSEIDTLGSYGRVEQVLQDALFACIGIAIGTFVALCSGGTQNAVWIVFIASSVLALILLIALVCVIQQIKKTKKGITG